MSQPDRGQPSRSSPASNRERRTILGRDVLKWVFAAEYAMQGLVNPFQGATYQPFFKHLRFDYGLSEAATQNLFAKSYLAWGLKPVIGFLIDAYGRTRTLLIGLLSTAILGFLLTPVVDRTALLFFGSTFLLSLVLAATDVAVDQATVLAGEEDSKATGRSKSTAVGLNQAICWAAVYGTGTLSLVLGGYLAEQVALATSMTWFASVPAVVLLLVLRLPRDRALPIPWKQSALGFWQGVNTGPILEVMLFYFIFNFQPGMGALWNNHLIANLRFSQSEVGIADGASYAGSFLGVLLFATKGVRWQDRYGLRRLFRLYILLSVSVGLTQYLQVDPWFSAVSRRAAGAAGWPEAPVRLGYLCGSNLLQGWALSLVRMSTLSLVGSAIPATAAGSLFAGFMSISNLATAFSYSSGAWLYQHGTEFALLRNLEAGLFGIQAAARGHLSIEMLILINSLAFLLSFACVRWLPDQRETAASEETAPAHPGPERWQRLSRAVVRTVNRGAMATGMGLFFGAVFWAGLDLISALVLTFFCATLLRKTLLDGVLRWQAAAESNRGA